MRTAVFTGGSRGIGFGIALNFIRKQASIQSTRRNGKGRGGDVAAASGWQVVLVGRDGQRLEEAAKTLKSEYSFLLDSSPCSPSSSFQLLVSTAQAEFSRVDQVRNLVKVFTESVKIYLYIQQMLLSGN